MQNVEDINRIHFFFLVNRSLTSIKIADVRVVIYIDTGTTRCPSASHSGKGNLKNIGKKLFTTNPLGALFTKTHRGTLGMSCILIG